MNRITLDLAEQIYGDIGSLHTRGESNKDTLNLAKQILKQVVVNQLTSRQQQIIMLRFEKGLNQSEIAELLMVNKSTVSRTINRAYNNIKKYMGYYKLR